jgi:hypothetical protein
MEKDAKRLADQALAVQQADALITIIVLIIVAGALAGWAAHLAQPRARATSIDTSTSLSWIGSVVLGIVAAACVPLFLSILKSELVVGIFRSPRGAGSLDSYLILTGLCIVAGFSSRRFIETITEQLLREVNQAQQDAAEAKAKASEATVVAKEAISEIEGADQMDGAVSPELQQALEVDEKSSSGGSFRLTGEERALLQAMTGKTYRTASGIAQDSGIPRHRISDLLERLAERKLVLPTKSPPHRRRSVGPGDARCASASAGLTMVDVDLS